MALISMRDVCWGFAEPPLLENVTFQIEKGERVCLVGRNGVGKSTLLKLLCGDMTPDRGDIWRRRGLKVAVLEQDVPAGFDGTIFDVVAGGLGPTSRTTAANSRSGNGTQAPDNYQAAKRRDGLQHMLEAEENQNRVFDKKLSREEAWIRKGIKARRTRNEWRVRSLQKMRAAYRARRRQSGNARLQVQEAERTGKLVIEARAVEFSYKQTPILRGFSTVIMRGDKVGIIGPNGAGKTTLLKILLKETKPQTGSVRHGTNLQVVHFDQMRAQLDEQKTVWENIDDWLSQRPRHKAQQLTQQSSPKKIRPKPAPRPSRKMGYMQQRELQNLPGKIEVLEAEQKALAATLSDPLFYQKGKDEIAGVKKNLDRVEHEIETAYRRWEELEAALNLRSKIED